MTISAASGANAPATSELPLAMLVNGYLDAFDAVVDSGFAHEVDWQERRRLEDLTETTFLREAAWVILSSGMREHVIRERFPRVSGAFLDWFSAQEIVRAQVRCAQGALRAFRHVAKVNAIVSMAAFVARASFASVHSQLWERGTDALESLPFIGPVTKFHLAKNLGVDVAKPDRHLVRLAWSAGISSPQRLCRAISDATGDRVATVDLVLWRYATLDRNYANLFVRPRELEAERTSSDASPVVRTGRRVR